MERFDVRLGVASAKRIRGAKSAFLAFGAWSCVFGVVPLAQADLVAHYKFDETSGTTAADSSGNSFNATSITAPAWGAGIIGNAVTFVSGNAGGDELIYDNGSNGRIVDVTNVDGVEMTVTTWVKFSTNAFQTAVYLGNERGSAFNNYFVLRSNNGRLELLARGTANDLLSTPGAGFDDGQWHHVALTATSNTSRAFYVNGQLVGTQTSDRRPFGRRIAFGATATEVNPIAAQFDGSLDDAGFWSEALGAEKLALIHGLGRLQGIDQSDAGIDAVLAVFEAGTGLASVGDQVWEFTDSLATGVTGSIGGSIAEGNAFILLDGDAGTGVVLIPEPTSIALLGVSGLVIIARRRHS